MSQSGCTAVEVPADFYNLSQLTGEMTRVLQEAYRYLNANVLGKDYLVDISVGLSASSFAQSQLPSGTVGCYTNGLSPSGTLSEFSPSPTIYELTFLGTFGSGFVQDNPQLFPYPDFPTGNTQ